MKLNLAFLGSCLLLCACQTLGPPPAELRELLPSAPSTSIRRISRSRLESRWFSGEFQSVLIEDHSEGPRIRLQLLPDLGTKVLDLIATPDRIQGKWTYAGSEEQRAGTERLSRWIGVSLLENAVPLTFDRVLAAREVADGYLLEIVPVVKSERTRIFVSIDQEGRVVGRKYQDRGVRWSEEFEAGHAFLSGGIHWELSDEVRTEIAAPPANLFKLDVEDGGAQ